MSLKELGTFEMTSNTIFVSDPCYPIKTSVADSGYTKDEDLSLILTPAKQGNWKATVYYSEDEVVTKLVATHIEVNKDPDWIKIDKGIEVDSGQAGIFDSVIYGKDEIITYEVKNIFDIDMDEEGLKFYVACCDLTGEDDQAGVIVGGAVSVSGLGDGWYQVYIQRDANDQIVGVLIDFYDKE
ncbi:DUF4241 domain-containing protein [Bacillus pseudomycoides]|uniref:DUF4241 domain-containing protein n=1 Tax=Bacillus pseudomycoides TaxID=64104 RepID=UPI0003303C53|nr:DUF4241 domain-containing protein [Bacillus pseudomycoides]EOP48696.1 hypothetical protein IIW_05345 [Bacillus cereus VD136]EOP63406.1 hypothetical protein KOW_05509 [Bacillus cereus VDM006]EOQ04715.1 hypothetical protein KOY_04890 [Bacillus cereus VDM021]EOQ05489.1 hypothetical protein KOY_05462 [Bacillus cereus VDM021]PEL22491.1 DUF4241 domain-containing protein [Bacillus pseudomycoides]